MKKYLTLFLFVIFSFSFSACGGGVQCVHDRVWTTVKESTCNELGSMEGLCSKCGNKEFIPIPLKSHQYVQIQFIDSTCSKEGATVYKCILCDDELSVPVVKKEHAYDVYNNCTVCGRGGINEYIEASMEGFIITIDDILEDYSLTSIRSITLNNVCLTADNQIKFKVNYNGIGFGASYNVDRIELTSNNENNKTISSIYISHSGILTISYTNNVEQIIGSVVNSNERDVRGFLLNTCNEIFAVLNNDQIIKIGKLSDTMGEELQNPLIYQELTDENGVYGYMVVGTSEIAVKDLIIPSEHLGKPVLEIKDYAFKELTNLKTVTFGDNVTTIGHWAFWKCTNLETITFGSSLNKIKNGAFYKTSLSTIKFNGSVNELLQKEITVTEYYNDYYASLKWELVG